MYNKNSEDYYFDTLQGMIEAINLLGLKNLFTIYDKEKKMRTGLEVGTYEVLETLSEDTPKLLEDIYVDLAKKNVILYIGGTVGELLITLLHEHILGRSEKGFYLTEKGIAERERLLQK